MTTYEAMKGRRSIRKFDGSKMIPLEILEKAVDVARLAPCGVNMQSLKYCVVTDPKLTSEIFALSKWGMMLKDGSGRPGAGEEPPVWILVLNDSSIKQVAPLDVGAASENIMIYCQSEGIGSCWLENIAKKEIEKLIDLPENLTIATSIALGYPAMKSKEVEITESGETAYFWGEDGSLSVPKRCLKDVMIIK